MEFTYGSYKELIELIQKSGYQITSFTEYETVENPCILRHDVDISPEAALEIARVEAGMGVSSTYYVLLNTGFYNIFNTQTNKILKEILKLGHNIGLHFDAAQYEDVQDIKSLGDYILQEIKLLESATGAHVNSFSIHRPTKLMLEAQLSVDGIINTYSETFFKKFKYLSDSRMRWRENPEAVISSKAHKSIQVLTHPIWYAKQNRSMQNVLFEFIDKSHNNILERLAENISDITIEQLMKK